MDTQRLILLAIFSFSLVMLWEAWNRDNRPVVPAPARTAGAPERPGDIPTSSAPAASTPSASAVPAGAVPGQPASSAPVAANLVTVTTDLFTVKVDPVGGVIAEVALAKHRDAFDTSKPYLALQRNAARTFVAQAGLLGDGMPNHRTTWEVLPGPRELAPGQDKLELRMQATAASGDKVVQTLTFHRGSYLIDASFEVTNATGAPISPFAYFQLARDTKHAVPQNSMAPSAYVGPVIYNSTDHFRKVEPSELDKLASDPSRKLPYTKNATDGWAGMIEHYFVSAWLPSDEKKLPREFFARKLDNGLYAAGVIVPMPQIAPGASATLTVPLFVGPQDQEMLKKVAAGLDLSVDYGIFTVIAAPLFWLLKWLHGLIGNWGWAIVVMTIMIKAAFYPLNAAAARSMGKMKLVAPKMKALQEQYANDKQALQMKMMELYKQEKINPLGGCLPIVVQIPVFIALYWVLLSAVELRHAPWIGWIHDLSAPDPFYILPVLYAISAWLQVKLSPTPITDPVQAKVFQIMPIAFSVLFIFFPSGLVLYWLVNNILQIGQQWQVNRMLEKEQALAAAKRR
ncbi:MAG TPA: membrane protein insertase YidC [Casimicrobiaceae bacterium]|nr:membrane protein insertase YidC [Casimicrobiaceae bacterium]